ncbi:MAG: ribbon-helix-helix protein, CopG family [Deltaproteobacteria bacterium]|nr:ribbon-helix-helix protein, CopG family [Deltaproteobacteria bacterium]
MSTVKKRAAITISMPQEMADEYDNLSRLLSKNRSVLFREMFHLFKKQILENEFKELQAYGALRTRKDGLFSESDVEKLVFEGR